MHPDDHLLKQNKIIIDNNREQTLQTINSKEIYDIIKQKPNKKIMGFMNRHIIQQI